MGWLRRLRCKRRHYEMIVSGRKTAECRIKGDHMRGIRAGELLEFFHQEDSVLAQVVRIRRFQTIEEVVSGVKISAVMPGVACANEAKAELLRLYSEDQIKKNKGFVVFEFAVLN